MGTYGMFAVSSLFNRKRPQSTAAQAATDVRETTVRHRDMDADIADIQLVLKHYE